MLARASSRKQRCSRASKILIPARKFALILPPRPVHPRALHEASLSRTGERWPRKGATRTPNARRLKLHGPGATDGVTGSLVAVPQLRAERPGAAAAQSGGSEPQPPGCHAEESLTNSARGTLVRRRTCGFLSPVLSAGPLDLAASRAPSDLFPLAYRLKSVGSRCPTRTMRLFKN